MPTRSVRSTPGRPTRSGRTCSASTATCTSGRSWRLRIPAGGSSSTSRANRSAPSTNGRCRTSPCATSRACSASFDYVAGALAHDAEPVDASAWAAEARARFLDGYQRGTGADLDGHSALLDAFELDKAVYEVVYETRNRPDWVGIPLAAVARLVGDSGS
ncbi:hypothetical protein Q9Q99_09925 [Curtobacterium flaccumfaciens]|nr:hypothetical protein Q9Q99_09925 [Curtobacterium flaccumfaciens]